MPGLTQGQPGLWGGKPGLNSGKAGLWDGVSGLSGDLGGTAPVLAPVNIGIPVIAGQTIEGSTLLGTPGNWINSPTGYAYQWKRNGADIPGATGATYLLVPADIGTTITVGVIASNSAGPSAQAVSLGVGPITMAVPTNTGVPVISGSVVQGSTLSTTNGTWTGSPSSFAYQWKRGGTDIPGATAATYLLVAADVGSTITVGVIASNAGGPSAVQAISAPVGPVTSSIPAATAVPTITGTPTENQTLTLVRGTYTNSPSSFTQQWKRGGTPIAGATGTTYVLVTADVGQTITVGEFATNAFGTSSPENVSAATAVIASAYVPHATYVFTRMVVQPSTAKKTAYSTFIGALDTAGVFAKLDALYILAGDTQQASNLNWIYQGVGSTFDLTDPGATLPTWVQDRGYTGNTTTMYLDTGFNPSTSGGQYTQNSASMGVWISTDVSGALRFDIGSLNQRINSHSAVSTAVMKPNVSANQSFALPANTAVGLTAYTRIDALNYSLYKNGGVTGPTTVATAALSVGNFLLLASTIAGPAPGNFSDRRQAIAFFGGALSDAQQLAMYNAVVALQGSIGFFLGFNALFNPAPALVYSEEDRLVVRTSSAGRLALRGNTGHITGKRYVELLVIGDRLRFAGVVDSSFNVLGAGGPAGTNRVGIEGASLVGYPGVIDPIGQFASAGTVVRIAYDATADKLWLALNAGPWNDNPAEDPETGVGGLSTGGLVGAGFVGVTLRPTVGAGVRYRVPGDLGYNLPAGFTEWSE